MIYTVTTGLRMGKIRRLNVKIDADKGFIHALGYTFASWLAGKVVNIFPVQNSFTYED